MGGGGRGEAGCGRRERVGVGVRASDLNCTQDSDLQWQSDYV